jgi:hypothetical protein
MRRVQHVQVKLTVTLTVQLPTAEELKDNITAFQEPALLNYAVTRWADGAKRTVNPERSDIGIVGMTVERTNP